MDCGWLLDFDRRLRYCAMLDPMGRTVAGGMRSGIPSLEPEEEASKVDLHMAVIRGMTEAARSYLGAMDYAVVHREKLMLVVIPVPEGNTVLVSAEPDFPLEKVEELLEAVKENLRRQIKGV